jgi:hypothetical protein
MKRCAGESLRDVRAGSSLERSADGIEVFQFDQDGKSLRVELHDLGVRTVRDDS